MSGVLANIRKVFGVCYVVMVVSSRFGEIAEFRDFDVSIDGNVESLVSGQSVWRLGKMFGASAKCLAS